jgi:hypothetical protein
MGHHEDWLPGAKEDQLTMAQNWLLNRAEA